MSNSSQFSLNESNNEPKTLDFIIKKLIDDTKEAGFESIKEQALVDNLFKLNKDNLNEIQKSFNENSINNEETKGKQFEYLLDKLILSTSPFIKYKLPYLLSEAGYKECSMKKYLPIEYINYYCSSKIILSLNLNQKLKFKPSKVKKIKTNSKTSTSNFEVDNNWSSNYEKKLKDPHEFLKIHLIKSVNEAEIKVMNVASDFLHDNI